MSIISKTTGPSGTGYTPPVFSDIAPCTGTPYPTQKARSSKPPIRSGPLPTSGPPSSSTSSTFSASHMTKAFAKSSATSTKRPPIGSRKITKGSFDASKESIILKVRQIGFTIYIQNKNIIADDGCGKRYKVDIFEGARNITVDALAADENQVKKLTQKVCDLLQDKGLLQGKEASISFANDAIEMSGGPLTSKKIVKIDSQNPHFKELEILHKYFCSALHSHTKYTLDKYEIDHRGNCLPGSLLHQIMVDRQPSKDPHDLIKSAKNDATKRIRKPVADKLKRKSFRNSLISLIKNNHACEGVKEIFKVIKKHDNELFTQMTASSTYSSLGSIDFQKEDFSNFSDDTFHQLLTFYGEYIMKTQKDGASTYMDPFFLNLYVLIRNKGKSDEDKIQIVILFPVKDKEDEIVSIIGDQNLKDDNFKNVYFVYHTGKLHYQSVQRNPDKMKNLIRKNQDSILEGFFNLASGYKGSSAQGSAAVKGLISSFQNLKVIHPTAYGAIIKAIKNKNSSASLNESQAVDLFMKALKTNDLGTVDACAALKALGITADAINHAIKETRLKADKTNQSKKHSLITKAS